MGIQWKNELSGRNAYITFYDNPIKSPPVEIIEQGKEAVRNWFEQREKEQEDKYLFETKVLIIGDGGVGKSSFVCKMKNKEAELPKDKDTTPGVEITKWNFEIDHPKRGKQRMYANFWDFGGQKLYRGTHQIFFSPKAFYVMLDDGREEKTDYSYWLNTVEQLAGNNSKLLVVLNQKHGHKPQPDKNGLKGRFGDLIAGFQEVDLSKTDHSIAALQNKLKNYLQDLPGMGDPLPASWVNIREELFSIDEKFISRDRYLGICRHHKTDMTKLLFVNEYFNRVGVFTYFYDDKILNQRVFLNSDWLLQNVYELLNHKTVKDKNGRIEQADLESVWQKEELLFETDYLIRLMHRFGLMYEVSDEKRYVVPAHLTAQQPHEIWQHENEPQVLQFAYEFDKYMPYGIMPRLIVALHGYIKNHDWVWSKGVNIENQNTRAEIKQTYDRTNKFLIRLHGEHKKELLSIIIYEFEKILSPFKKLDYEKSVPCICSKCKNSKTPHFYNFSNLENRKNKRKQTIECDISFEDVNVKALLNGVSIEEKRDDCFEIENLIAQGRVKQAIERLLKLVKYNNPDMSEKLMLFLVQWTTNENDRNEGLIDHKDYVQAKARINKAILEKHNEWCGSNPPPTCKNPRPVPIVRQWHSSVGNNQRETRWLQTFAVVQGNAYSLISHSLACS